MQNVHSPEQLFLEYLCIFFTNVLVSNPAGWPAFLVIPPSCPCELSLISVHGNDFHSSTVHKQVKFPITTDLSLILYLLKAKNGEYGLCLALVS